MQRINWFPDPLITGTMKIEAGNNAKIDYPVANNRKWLRATSVAAGNNYGQYILLGSQLPPAGTYHVHALVYAQKATADFRIYARVDGTYRMLLDVPVGNDMTITIDQNITIPSNTDQLLIRIALDQKTVGMKGMMSDILIERADTYDTAVGGGASGLLHRRHDTTRLRRFVGRVMSDDGHEPDKQSKSPRHAATWRVHADFDHREDSGYHILVHGLAGRVGRLHHDRELFRHLQQEPTHRMVLQVPDRESDEPEIQCRVRQSDRQGVEHGHVRAGRIPGEQGLARRPLLFRRGYDAARLTLALGVVA